MLFNISLIVLIMIIYLLFNVSNKYPPKWRNDVFLTLSFIIILILSASRDFNTGSDTLMYTRTFADFSAHRWNSTIFGGYFEPLYAIFNILLSYISKKPRTIIAFSSLFIDYSFYKFIRENSKNYFLSTLMFIGLLFFYTSINIIRQFMAIAVILLGFKYVKEKKLVKYLLVVAIAFLFHSSALIGILIYPMYNMKYSDKIVMIIFIVAITANIFISPIIDIIYSLINRTNYYYNRIGTENIANLIYAIMYFIMFLFSYFEIRKNKKETSKKSFYLYSFILSSAFSLIAMNMNVLARITTYFNIFSIICLPNIIEENIKTVSNRIFCKIIAIIFVITYSSVIIKFRPNWNTAFDYHSCLTGQGTNCDY